MDRTEYEDRWRRAHRLPPRAGGRLVPAWLGLVRALALPLHRSGVPPTVLTVAGLALAWLAVVAALPGGRWALAASALVAASGLADGLDGAVALLGGRPSRWGSVVDAGADRLSEVAFGGVLWALGAPWPPVLAAVGLSWWLEYLRERASSSVPHVPVVVTVGERPTRVLVVAMFALAAGLLPDVARLWATGAAVAWLLAGLAGLLQLVAAWGRLGS